MKRNEFKEPIRLRKRELKGGSKSLYLDCYFNGRRTYETLHLYLVPEQTPIDVANNKETLKLANLIKSKRILAMQHSFYGLSMAKEYEKADFVEYIRKCGKRATQHGNSSVQQRENVIKKLKKYAGVPQIQFRHINKEFVLGFVDYLKSTRIKSIGKTKLRVARYLSEKTIHSYFALLSADITSAYRDGYLAENPISKLNPSDRPKDVDAHKEYLTEVELQSICDLDLASLYGPTLFVKAEYMRGIFLFSCFTGLRLSDIKTLKWGDIIEDDRGIKSIRKKMIKTGGIVEFPMSEDAVNLLPMSRKKDNELVFASTYHTFIYNYWVRRLAELAGVKKHLTFHCARHTFATMLITKGADLYTVSKLLGHSEIKSTEVYAKVVKEVKMKAIDYLPKFTIK